MMHKKHHLESTEAIPARIVSRPSYADGSNEVIENVIEYEINMWSMQDISKHIWKQQYTKCMKQVRHIQLFIFFMIRSNC